MISGGHEVSNSLLASASTAADKVVKTIKLGTSTKNYDPTGITVAADGKTVYVAGNRFSISGVGGVTVIGTAKNTVTTTITAGEHNGERRAEPGRKDALRPQLQR